MTQLSLFYDEIFENLIHYNSENIQTVINEYCGTDLSDIIKSGPEKFQTKQFWEEYHLNPSFNERVLVELLHLAYMQGGRQ